MLQFVRDIFQPSIVKIKYSRPLKKFIVTHKYQGIIFVGEKSRCEWYIENHKVA